jgi:hypothetical protein
MTGSPSCRHCSTTGPPMLFASAKGPRSPSQPFPERLQTRSLKGIFETAETIDGEHLTAEIVQVWTRGGDSSAAMWGLSWSAYARRPNPFPRLGRTGVDRGEDVLAEPCPAQTTLEPFASSKIRCWVVRLLKPPSVTDDCPIAA